MRKINILDFEEILKGIDSLYYIDIKIRESEPFDSPSKYYVSFNKGYVIGGGCTIGAHGNGKTPDEAIKEYCKKISGEILVFGFSKDSFKIKVPELYYEVPYIKNILE